MTGSQISADSGDNRAPLTPEGLLNKLSQSGADVLVHRHRAVFTVGEGMDIKETMPGAHTRNLFLKDHKGKMFLVTLRQETMVDLKKLSIVLGAGRFSFGSPERLWDHLGVLPGSVTPFAILNDWEGAVTLVLEEEMLAEEIVNFHPLVNTMTVGLSPADLMTFLAECGKTPRVVDLTPAQPD
jgi:Ala-tRNA(Pro) deacylase